MTVRDALGRVASQHEGLRARMDHCTDLADKLETGDGSPDALVGELAELRAAFERHNRYEEEVLRPIMKSIVDQLRIEGIVAEHVEAHRRVDERFAHGPLGELRATIAMLRDHLAEEEHHFSQAAARASRPAKLGA